MSEKQISDENIYASFVKLLQEEALVSSDDLEWLMNDFRETNGYTEEEFKHFLNNDVEQVVPLLLPEEGRKYKFLVIAAIKTIVKYVEKNLYLPGVWCKYYYHCAIPLTFQGS